MKFDVSVWWFNLLFVLQTFKLYASYYIFPYSNTYPTICNVTQFISICKLLYMFRVVSPPIIRITHNCIYSIWHLSNGYCYLPLSRQVAVTVWHVPDTVNTVVCAPDDGWRYHPKHVEQFPDINKLCNVASCWIYIGIYLRCTDPWTLKYISHACIKILYLQSLCGNTKFVNHFMRDMILYLAIYFLLFCIV